jgi:hypothetical protein
MSDLGGLAQSIVRPDSLGVPTEEVKLDGDASGGLVLVGTFKMLNFLF